MSCYGFPLTRIFPHYGTLREKSPYSELFWPVFSHIRTKYGAPYSARMWEKMDQNNSEYGDFLRSDRNCNSVLIPENMG